MRFLNLLSSAGKIIKIMVEKNEKVKVGQPILIIEAMKMETTVTAISSGIIDKVLLESGSLVDTSDLVVKLK